MAFARRWREGESVVARRAPAKITDVSSARSVKARHHVIDSGFAIRTVVNDAPMEPARSSCSFSKNVAATR
jgi:hypothetical protein